MALSQQTTQYLSTYGKASASTSRFQILGDNRIMYSVSAAGSTYDFSTPPHKIEAGSTLASLFSGGSRNMISNGGALFPFGAKSSILSPVALRLGVTGASGGNVLTSLNEYGFVWGTQRLDAGVHYTYMANGEAAFQDTNATSGAYGASIEQFQNNVNGTVAVSGTTVTGIGTTFTTAALGGASGVYNGVYTPSVTTLQAGDLILVTDGGVKYWHRINVVTNDTTATIYPTWVGTGSAGKAYSLWRSGYGSYSRVVPIYNSNTGGTAPQSFFNYYVGTHRSTSFPGTIQCFTREASGAAASSHFTCPQNSSAQDIKAVDIAYYKSFMLYGYGGAIGWSKAGFPTSFTTGFGAADFPAGNLTVVANDDQFVSFEYMGEQLIALFKNSIWQIQASGSVPEFNFYKIAEPVGPVLQSTAAVQTAFVTYRRPTVSARNSIYYHSHIGLLHLSGTTAVNVSLPVRGTWNKLGNAATTNPQLSWEQSTNSVLAIGPVSPNNSSDAGFLYCEDQDAWSVYDPANSTRVSSGQNIRGSSTSPTTDSFCMFAYDGTNERIIQVDQQLGAPFATNLGNAQWEWWTPVISMGDQYDGFQFTGFQLDGFYASTTSWVQYGGKTPYALVQRAAGTMASQDNRRILGIKSDDPFISFKFSTTDGSWVSLLAVNVYADGLGK